MVKTYRAKSNWWTKSLRKKLDNPKTVSGRVTARAKWKKARPVLTEYDSAVSKINLLYNRGKISKIEAQKRIDKIYKAKRKSFRRALK